jgi:hypothetical protein
MRSRQKGITFIGWIFLLAPLAILVFTAIKVLPVYLNYFKVARVMEQVASENDSDAVTQQNLINRLQNRFDVEDVDHPVPRDIVITREGGQGNWLLNLEYDDQAGLFGGISLLVHFEKSVVVK